MPIYVYETIPQDQCEEPTQFELMQRMTEKALTVHPDTGQPVRRVITGGIALRTPSIKKGCCESQCSC